MGSEHEQPRRRTSDCFEEISRHDKSAAACFADLDRRVDRVESKIDTLDQHVRGLDGDVREFRDSGCAYRSEEARRIERLESGFDAVQKTIAGFKDAVSEFKIEVVKEISGIRYWVLIGVLGMAMTLLGWLFVQYVVPELRHTKPMVVSTATGR